jgi:recombinational DNA repair ATPase RecF
VTASTLAEFNYLQQQRLQSPLLLFDDIFGELDARRIKQMLQQVSHIGQVFVTTTSRNFFDKIQHFETPIHYYQVSGGRIAKVEE